MANQIPEGNPDVCEMTGAPFRSKLQEYNRLDPEEPRLRLEESLRELILQKKNRRVKHFPEPSESFDLVTFQEELKSRNTTGFSLFFQNDNEDFSLTGIRPRKPQYLFGDIISPCEEYTFGNLTSPWQDNTFDSLHSPLQDKSSTSNLKKQKKTMPRDPGFQRDDTFNQHKYRKTAKLISSSVVSAILLLRNSLDIYALCQSPMFQLVQQVHQEQQHGHISIWPSLLTLLGFMIFLVAVTMMIMIGVPFTRMQRAMLAFCTILMYVRSATSISGLYIPILGIFLMGWQIMKGNE